MPPSLLVATAFLAGWAGLAPAPSRAQTYIETGAGTNRCHLMVNFSSGERLVFQHRWNGLSLDAKTFLESVIEETGGELVVTDGYLTPFSSAVLGMRNPSTLGLVVHYQGSFLVPYLNGIRWNGPAGPVDADYVDPDGWWHLWAKGPAHVDQSYAWPNPLPPVELAADSAWFFGEFSGLADLTLADGGWLGFVYGSALAPIPEPSVPCLVWAAIGLLCSRNRRKK